MEISDWLFQIIAALLVLYVAFVTYKLYHEYRFRRKPFVAMKELAWQSQTPTVGSEIIQEILLVGDFGNVSPNGNDTVLKALEKEVERSTEKSTIIFLGDNIYPVGLPAEGNMRREMAEKRLNCQISLLKDFKGRIIYISGNHDWNKGRANGFEQVLRQEEYINSRLGPVFLPPAGCPGPLLINVHPDLAILVINTQWWVQRGEKPIGKAFNCTAETEEDFFEQLASILNDNQHRKIMIAAHHPLYSNALHGGKHTFKHHVFPLTAAHKKLYIPVPVIGSLYPLYRRIFGANEDMAHPRYRRLRKKLLRLFHSYNNLVYAAGHDHNLQHFRRKGNHYLISGSASKTSYVKKGGKASFTHEHLGFMKLCYYSENEAWLSVLEPDMEKKDGSVNVIYNSKLG